MEIRGTGFLRHVARGGGGGNDATLSCQTTGQTTGVARCGGVGEGVVARCMRLLIMRVECGGQVLVRGHGLSVSLVKFSMMSLLDYYQTMTTGGVSSRISEERQ